MNPTEAPHFPFTSSLTRTGQVTIPAYIRRLLGLSTSDKVAFLVTEGKVEIASATSVAARTAGALRQYRHTPAPTTREEREAFEQAVSDQVGQSLGG